MRPIRSTALISTFLVVLILVEAAQAQEAPVDIGDIKNIEELSLDDLLNVEVVSATGTATRLSRTPVPVTVVTGNQIRQSGLTSLPAILGQFGGVDLLPIGVSQAEISVHGKMVNFNRRMLVLVDGRTEYDDAFGVTFWHAIPVSLDDIERIEVVRGPASTLFGPNAFSGVINIITKKNTDTVGAYAHAVGGTYVFDDLDSLYVASGVHGNFFDGLLKPKLSGGFTNVDSYDKETVFKGRGARGVGTADTSSNFVPVEDLEQPQVDGPLRLKDPQKFNDDTLQRWWITGSLASELSEDLELVLRGGYSESGLDLIFQPGLPRSRWTLRKGYASLTGDYTLAEAHSLSVVGYINYLEYQTPLVPFGGDVEKHEPNRFVDGRYYFPSLPSRHVFFGDSVTYDAKAQYAYQTDLPSVTGDINVVAGVEIRHTDHDGGRSVEQDVNDDTDYPETGLLADRSRTSLSAFSNATLTFLEDVQAAGGFRYDQVGFDEFANRESGYGYTVSLGYYFSDTHSIKASARGAYRTPTLFERDATFRVNVKPNARLLFEGNNALESELINAQDLNYLVEPFDWLQLNVELFHEAYERLIGNPDSSQLGVGTEGCGSQTCTRVTFQNLASAEMLGAVLGLRLKFDPGLQFYGRFGYRYPSGLNDLSGEIFLTPSFKLHLGGRWQTDGFSIGVDFAYIGETNPDEFGDGATFTEDNQQAYLLLNARVGYLFDFPEWSAEVYISGQNLLGSYVAYWEGDPILNAAGESLGLETLLGLRMTYKYTDIEK